MFLLYLKTSLVIILFLFLIDLLSIIFIVYGYVFMVLIVEGKEEWVYYKYIEN